MNRIELFFCSEDPEENVPGIGVKWCLCEDRPFIYIPKPDRPYWSYLNVRIFFFRRSLWIDIRLRRLPYENKDQYISWLRKKRASERILKERSYENH